ncbi:Ribulose-phosphate 3-epimerase [Sedimentisphaera cyanobacteriorum]|uniref:Ribulose-phosphate 3-epimerase n=1 Tax=Sedimentisphaera cyanobacteriorum TaxID=1940790 RepID=A0A1Q2HSW9_9BACT|nr:ribulose-phosphate 3-epimerase [Sedimentisphaera cyanobacteriorum]AQQ10353.1 Ribulose-phosphate 3-epimerase [Sedimentisphaera cyanobacteriorum]
MHLPEPGTIEIAPSLLSADFSCLAEEVSDVENSGVKIIHLDIMDGHFVPNITIGPPVVSSLRKTSDLCFDAHLMISQPQRYIKDFANAGADHITFHIEAEGDPRDTIAMIEEAGCSAGICIKPATSPEEVLEIASLCRMILVMTVEPGFGGQVFREKCAEKCAFLRETLGKDLRIEVDGGINEQTAGKAGQLGADTLVAGSAVFGSRNRREAIEKIADSAIKS